ncbi:MAG: hypothetical protein M3R17_04740 [Bacteroidota bacterium]|nr:hypothetical protein [Bacteroidota bacterium]
MSKLQQKIFSSRTVSIFFIFLPLLSFSQQHKVDSLKAALSAATHDTTLLALHAEIGLAYYNFNSDSSLSWWKRGCLFSMEKKNKHTGAALKRILTIESGAMR